MISLPRQRGGEAACCGIVPCPVIAVGSGGLAVPRASGHCITSSRAGLKGGDCAIVFANNTCALIHRGPLFLPAVTSEKRKAAETAG